MLKRGIISGLASAGVNPLDLRSMPIPVARYFTRHSETAGGIHVRLSPYDSRVVDIKFFDEHGQDLGKQAERNMERVFFREDFRRVYLDEIGTISYAEHVVERYSTAFCDALDLAVIQKANPYVVVDFANAPTAQVLAPLLAQLNCRVVALNEAVDETKMSISPQELQESLRQLGKICEVLETTFGVRLDVGGERVFVVDSSGEAIASPLLCLALAIVALKSEGGGTIAVPVSMPNVIEQIAERYGGHVLRTKLNAQALMEAANHPDVIMVGDGNGSFIWPAFQPVVDGMMTVAKILEFMTTQETTLAQVIREVPPYHVAQGEADCPWESKGTVMRLLNRRYKDRLGEQIDGVKINLSDSAWVLVLPDLDRPVFHIYAQAGSEEQVRDLVARYERIVTSPQQ